MRTIKKLLFLLLFFGFVFHVSYGNAFSTSLKSKIEVAVFTIEQKIIKGDYSKREKIVTILNEYKTTGGQKKREIIDYILEAISPSFDGCGSYTKYSSYDRFDVLENKLGALDSIVYTSADFIEGCLSKDGKYFIMIEKDNGLQHGALINFNTTTHETRLIEGWFTSIGKRHNTYIEMETFDLTQGGNILFRKYYYMDNVFM